METFTKEYGRIGLIAKGARLSKSRHSALLQPFVPNLLSWSGRSELCTLTGAELRGQALALQGRKLLSGFYMNELIIRFLQRNDPHPGLFDIYNEVLSELMRHDNEEAGLRRFERVLLQEVGYGLILGHDVETGEPILPDRRYCYHIEKGPVLETEHNNQGIVLHGKTLLELLADDLSHSTSFREAKQLMRAILSHYLGGRPLKTRDFQWQPTRDSNNTRLSP